VAVSCAHCDTLLGSGISGRGGELFAVQEGLRSERLCVLFVELSVGHIMLRSFYLH
jgi:hypothetical protein